MERVSETLDADTADFQAAEPQLGPLTQDKPLLGRSRGAVERVSETQDADTEDACAILLARDLLFSLPASFLLSQAGILLGKAQLTMDKPLSGAPVITHSTYPLTHARAHARHSLTHSLTHSITQDALEDDDWRPT